MKTIRRAVLLLITGTLLFTMTVSCDNPLSLFQKATTTQLQTDITTLGPNGEVPTQGPNGEVPTEGKTGAWEATQADRDASREAATEAAMKAQKEILKRKDNKKSPDELITQTIDIDAFLAKLNSHPYIGYENFIPSMADVDEHLKIECLRKSKAGNYYSVHKMAQGGLLYIFYGSELTGNKDYLTVYRWFAVQKKLSNSDFSSIWEGAPIADVEAIDPVTSIYIRRADNYAKHDDNNRITFFSQHYLTDGILTIFYEYKNGECIVKSTDYEKEYQATFFGSQSNPEYNGKILDIDAFV